LAFAAPVDQLYTATEVNEWAWQRACSPSAKLQTASNLPAWDIDPARAELRAMAVRERRPAVVALIAAAEKQRLPAYFDDEMISIGEGEGSLTWPLEALPSPDDIEWDDLHPIPKALVTGS